jgi:hypothetical protein
LRTIERIVLPFEARSLPLADTNPNDLSRDFLERQAILRGSQKLGKAMQALGTSMTAYGSTTTPRGRNSVVMRRGSDGKKQWKGTHTHEGVKYDRPAPRGNKWSGYETKPNSKAGTKAPSSRSTQVSTSLVRIGSILIIGGKAVPVLGAAWWLHDMVADEPLHRKGPRSIKEAEHEKAQVYENAFDSLGDAASSPLGKAVISVGLSKLGFSLF